MRIATLGMVWALAGIAIGAGYYQVRQYVDRQLVFPISPPRVILVNQPDWMSDRLAQQIIQTVRPAGTHSAFDQQLLMDINGLLQANPWVRRVNQVRRVYGNSPGDAVEVDCDYRAPVALVRWANDYILVDGEGYQLPEQYTAEQLNKIMLASDGTISLRVITGVGHAPTGSATKWPGDDLAGGLAMVKVLYGQPYVEQIWAVNVANFKGRNDPHGAELVLLTRQGTEVRWGQAPGDRDYFVEVPVAQKMRRLESAWRQYGRVDANQPWIDIRFDNPITATKAPPAPGPLAGAQGTRRSGSRSVAIP